MAHASEPAHHHRPEGSRAFRRAGGGLVGPEGLARRCCTSSIRCGSNISASRSTITGRRDETGLKPLAGKRAADVGCGAGLLAEPLARLGAAVTGIDAAPENIAAARAHALGQGLEIDYRVGGAEALDGALRSRHLARGDRACRRPGGLRRRAGGGGGRGRAADPLDAEPHRNGRGCCSSARPKGSGGSRRARTTGTEFVTPDELKAMVAAAGLEVVDVTGLGFSLTRGFTLGEDMSLNYLLTARRR